MKFKKNSSSITSSKNQLTLFGYENYFNSFIKLFNLGSLPRVTLLTGPKGLGKATFLYHFINFILSKNEDKNYSISNYKINENNLSYKLLINNIHPNFFLLDTHLSDEEIKIDSVRNLKKFLTKSSYSKDLKLVLIDNSESLNQNSLNALLKPIEEPSSNTFFFIVYSTSFKIPDTLKSRSFEYKIFFTEEEKKNILNKILLLNTDGFNLNHIENHLYAETPGNILNHVLNFEDVEEKISSNHLQSIFYLIDLYKKDKNKNVYSTLLFLIEIFYNKLFRLNISRTNIYYFNFMKILKLMNDLKRYHLDEKSILFQVTDIIKNER